MNITCILVLLGLFIALPFSQSSPMIENLNTLLLEAVRCNYPTCVEAAILKGADVDFRNSDNQTPLTIACTQQDNLAYYTPTLLKGICRADCSNINYRCHTACIHMQYRKSREYQTEQKQHYDNRATIIKILLQAGANPDLQDSTGNTALHYACRMNLDTQHIDLLLEWGVQVNIQSHMQRTPLIEAITDEVLPQEHKAKVIKKLLAAGATVGISDWEKTAYDYELDTNCQYEAIA
jgi:ankyrin repeat protein